jgi:uncharacterized membrane protein
MQKEYLVDLEDAAIAVRKENGKIKLRQLYNLTGASAISGGFWGLLIGLIFLNPLLGAAVGAGAGAVSGALADVGVNDRFMKELAEKLKPGGSMLFVLFRSISLDKALRELEGTGGTIIRTSLSHEDEDRLRAALALGAPQEARPEKPKEAPKAVCCAASKEPPAYYNNTFEKAHADPEEREAVYGCPSREAEKALADDAARTHRCTDDAEAAVSRNASPSSNLHCRV